MSHRTAFRLVGRLTLKHLASLSLIIKSKHSCGNDDISNSLLKQIADPLLYPLSIIFNKSLQEGIFPDSMKIAKVIPLYKSLDNSSMTNYRPISLLPVISKVLERIVYKRVYNVDRL